MTCSNFKHKAPPVAQLADPQQHSSDTECVDRINHQADHYAALTGRAKSSDLTATQQSILDQITVDVASPNVHTVGIWGNAGTGKTFLTAALTQSLQSSYGINGVRMVATTHKASRQVEKAMASHGVVTEVNTIHRLLGVRLVRDESDGKEYFAADKYNPPMLDKDVQVVIVDETSMLSQQLYELLMDAIALWQTVVFVGDDQQLPPVSDGRLCGAFPEECR